MSDPDRLADAKKWIRGLTDEKLRILVENDASPGVVVMANLELDRRASSPTGKGGKANKFGNLKRPELEALAAQGDEAAAAEIDRRADNKAKRLAKRGELHVVSDDYTPDDEWLDAEAEERPWRADPDEIFNAPPLHGIWHTSTGEVLLVAGAVNNIVSDTGMGKTFCALFAAVEVIAAGGRVYWHNLDDTRPNVKVKIVMLGLKEAFYDPDVFGYGETDIDSHAQRLNIIRWLKEAADNDRPALYIGDTMDRAGCPPDGSPITAWWDIWATPFENTGITSLWLDHLPRYTDDRGGAGGSGNQAKGGRITGNGYRLQGPGWTQTKEGHITLIGDKPKTGQFRPGDPCATITVTYDPNGAFCWTVDAPNADSLKHVLLDLIGTKPGLNTSELRTHDAIARIVGKDYKPVTKALDQLERDKLIRRDPGSKNSKLHYIAETGPPLTTETGPPPAEMF